MFLHEKSISNSFRESLLYKMMFAKVLPQLSPEDALAFAKQALMVIWKHSHVSRQPNG